MTNQTSNGMNEDINKNNDTLDNITMDLSSKNKSKKVKTIMAIIIAALIILAAVYYFDLSRILSGNKTVAIVNGEKIKMSEIDERFEQITTLTNEQGVNTDDPVVASATRLQILDEIINTKILAQNAKEAGIEIDAEAVEKEIQFIIDQIGDEKTYKDQLYQAGITEKQFKNSVAERLAIQEYISQNVDLESINVTDKEISEFYKQISATQKNVPPLDAISPQIASQLLFDKQQQAVVIFAATLRDTADIETSL